MNKIGQRPRKSKRKSEVVKVIPVEEYEGMKTEAKVELIQELIPLGLMKVKEELQAEVRRLAGERYNRTQAYGRHGGNIGSVVLARQRVRIEVPRVRDYQRGIEIPLEAYQRLHAGTGVEESALKRVLKGLSMRDYREASLAVPEALGLSSSNISREFIRASLRKLKALMERNLSKEDFVVIMLDGKSFAKDQLITAIGITMKGKKVMLGFIEAKTENKTVVEDFLKRLLERGFHIEEGILVVIDGSKGLYSAVKNTFNQRAVIQRCQWHKRENVVEYVSKKEQPDLRRRLQKAYERPNYEEAKTELLKIREELEEKNLSAVASLEEGFEETLTLHRLGVFGLVGESLKTVNCMESIHAQVEQRCSRVDYWRNSSQRQRWLAAVLLDIEPRLRKIKGHGHLPKLREAIQKELSLQPMNLKEAA
jgi:transposase-like protein